MVYIMAFISTEITKSISDEIACMTQDTINKAISKGWSLRRYLMQVFYVVESYRGEAFFGDGVGTHGTYTLDVKDDHIFTMMKKIMRLKGLEYTVSA